MQSERGEGRVSAPSGADSLAEELDLIASGELRLLGLMPDASNYTFLAEVGGGERAVRVVYKPRAGEMPLWDFPDGTLHLREVAAYEVACALGWPNVPPTILRDGPHGRGAVQRYVQADRSQHFFTMRDTRLDEFRTVAAFDALVNNADRKAGHCLVDPDGAIWVVDHGVCFSSESKLRTVIWDFEGQPIEPPLLRDIRGVAGEIRTGGLGRTLRGLLSAREVAELSRRADELFGDRRRGVPRMGFGR
jgi:uncharacterized repeat protein (TIGR03843 family)